MASTRARSCPPSLCALKRKAAAQTNPVARPPPQGQADHAHLAIDGKTLRATCSQPHPVHQRETVMRLPPASSCGIAMLGRKRMRRVALKPRFSPHLIKGRILTLDAMHTQRAVCAQVQRLGGKYVLLAKDNQPTRRVDIADLLEDRTPDRRRWRQAETWAVMAWAPGTPPDPL